jgi:hypothetical protein
MRTSWNQLVVVQVRNLVVQQRTRQKNMPSSGFLDEDAPVMAKPVQASMMLEEYCWWFWH